MPFCSHCNRNVSRTTELLHRKHRVRPRLTADAVAAFRKSVKSVVKNTRRWVRARSPLPHSEDVLMDDESPSTPQQADHDDILPTHVDPRHALLEATTRNTQARTWPHGRQYAARVDDYESDDEDDLQDEEDRSREVDVWSFDDTDDFDVSEYTNGLSPWDELGEDFEREAVENGRCFLGVLYATMLIFRQVKTLVPRTWPLCVRLR